MKSNEISQFRKTENFPSRSVWLLTVLLWPIAHGANLTVTDGSSSAVGANIKLTLGALNRDTGNLPNTTNGTAPGPYNVPENTVPLAVNTPLLVNAGGVIHTTASSTVDGLTGPRTTSASARVANLSLNIAGVIDLSVPNANGASATTTISGEGGSFTSNSSVALDGLTISVLGIPLTLPSPSTLSAVPANTGVHTVLGLAIILNDTVTVGTPSGGYTTTTNAIRIKLTGFQGLNGDIIIGQARAEQGSDLDGDGIFSSNDGDGDADGDGIPSAVEIANAALAGGDTDGDGTPDHLDLDSDNDGINDVIEAGGKDVNRDGIQDASGDGNPDEDGDGIVDSVDPEDNILGGGKGTVLTVPNTDGDLRPNYVDLDSDNDGLSDLVESGQAPSSDGTGVLPSADTDGDGISDGVDGLTGFGDAPGASAPLPDSDIDGIPNAFETDSNNDGTPDINGTAFAGLDGNGDGRIDNNTDSDGDGIVDVADHSAGEFGGLASPTGDSDGDGISNEDEGLGLVDTDGDGLSDMVEGDSDGDGIPDLIEGTDDFDGDGVSNARDLDSDGDGINDVIEAGGRDANGNGLQDPSGDVNPDEDGDGLVDTVDSNDPVNGGGTGTPLPRPDSDGDGTPNFLDLDSDNDTISDLVESGVGASDSNNDGISDGADPDGDGLAGSSDGSPAAFGDTGGSTPIDTDGDGIPNHLDPDSDGNGVPDINTTGNGGLDGNGDGRIDNATDTDGDGIPDAADDDDSNPGGLNLDLQSYAGWIASQFTAPGNSNPEVSGPNADPDHDGFSNAAEFAFGSDPESHASIPVITSTTTTTGGVTTVATSVVRNPGVYAFVFAEASRDLATWSTASNILTVNLDQPELLNAQISSVLGAADASRGFIRFRVVIP